MTVKQLIEELEKCAPDKEVVEFVGSWNYQSYEPIIEVIERKEHVEVSW